MMLRNQARGVHLLDKRLMDVDQELYRDFKLKYGIDRPEDSHLVQSLAAEIRREQIYKYKQVGKDLPGFNEASVREYAQTMDRNNEVQKRRQNHAERFA